MRYGRDPQERLVPLEPCAGVSLLLNAPFSRTKKKTSVFVTAQPRHRIKIEFT